jgi:hypothetical protein
LKSEVQEIKQLKIINALAEEDATLLLKLLGQEQKKKTLKHEYKNVI